VLERIKEEGDPVLKESANWALERLARDEDATLK
jgi:hypothetical protein